MATAKAKSSGVRRINRGRGHSYTIDGQKVTGVTTLIKGGRPNEALKYWAAKEVAQYVVTHLHELLDYEDNLDGLFNLLRRVPDSVRNAAAVRGTKLHVLAEKLVDGAEVELPEDIEGHVTSYVTFLDAWKVEPVLVEATVGSRTWAYGGTCDLVADVTLPMPITREQAPWLEADIPAGTRMRMLFDPKTARSGIFPDAAYQMAAYRYAEVYLDADGNEQPMADLGIEMAAAVHVRGDAAEVVPVNAGEETFRTFTYLATVARRVDGDKALIGAPVYAD